MNSHLKSLLKRCKRVSIDTISCYCNYSEEVALKKHFNIEFPTFLVKKVKEGKNRGTWVYLKIGRGEAEKYTLDNRYQS